MTYSPEPLPSFLSAPSRLGSEIAVTGRWTPAAPGGWFFRSPDSKAMRSEWEEIHEGARRDPGVLATEIDHGVGDDAVLVHHVFAGADQLLGYFGSTAARHAEALHGVANPGLHLVRGTRIPESVRVALAAKGVDAAFGEYRYGFVRDEAQRDLDSAIHVTAKWTCAPGESVEELAHWWQKVGTDAHDIEPGMVRFEVFRVLGEDALIVHEVFRDSATLRFHLSKGTAARYKADIDAIAAPEGYFFRGPVSWDIRTYSKFLGLPATYTSLGRRFVQDGGSRTEGLTTPAVPSESTETMTESAITVVYKWIAKPGQLGALASMYEGVTRAMEANEPGATSVHCYVSEEEGALYVRDEFADAGALGFHLGSTAAAHFPDLLQIATPAQFLFFGDVPAEMQAAARQMGLAAEFAAHSVGYDRASA